MSNNQDKNQSEVARIKAQIAAEQESAQRALHSPAYGTSQHKFITRRMERMGAYHDRLKDLVGDDEATRLFNDALEKGKEAKDGKE